ncbi:VOC family protein [Halovenus sp. WSH3]|uniref:VOC family protein n=1 Tax=Halovenus carboxidivorans TaxID=2692199 RepID=A0A6B0T925_9EURY|nr:VOC family protein [Halovenus carboxidivorans]MXR52073.1 VOC family protein [Halovenus carboxidivorans]
MNEPSSPLPPGTEIGRTALRVADRTAVVEFYREVVGLDPLRESDSRTVLGVDGEPLLVLTEGEDSSPRASDTTGLFHNAVRVPTRAALGAALRRVRERWRLDGASDHGVSEALYLTDPEGNGVEIYRDRPREEWPRTDDGGVEMGTYPLALEDVAADDDGSDAAPPGTDIGHVHLEVSSLEAVDSFYTETLGFEVQAQMADARFLGAGGYHHHIGANTWNRRTEPAEGLGIDYVEVVVPDGDAFDTLRDRLDSAQHSVTETPEGISVRDPDGIEIRVRVT